MKELSQLTQEEINIFTKFMKADFKTYIRVMFPYVGAMPFIFKEFHNIIIKKLQNISDAKNKKRNLILSLPVGSGKSILVELWLTWNFARNINNCFLYTSHSDRLVRKLSKEVRDIIMSSEWQLLFNTPLENDDKSKINFSFVGSNIRTGLTASAIGGSITGLDCGTVNGINFTGALIVDDPIDVSNIRYENFREECVRTYTDKLCTRRRNPSVPAIIIQQRLSPKDLVGWILENESDEYDIVKIPALNEQGQSFWPERFPLYELEKIKKINPIKFYSQYQQEPISEKGTVINIEWFKYYNAYEIGEFDRLFIVGDTALKVNEWNDYSVFQAWGLKNNNLYLIDGIKFKAEAPELKRKAIDFWKRFQYYSKYTYCHAFYIEDKASGIGLVQELQRDTSIPVIPVQVTKDKLTRVEEILGSIEAGRVYLPNNNPYTQEFLSECMAFSRDTKNNKHDDQIDCLSMAINKGISLNNISILDVLY